MTTPGESYRLPPSSQGCSVCKSPDVTTMDGICGRRCPAHPPVYDRPWALSLVDLGLAGEAFAYLRACLAARARGQA
jgi:hypothetical protein